MPVRIQHWKLILPENAASTPPVQCVVVGPRREACTRCQRPHRHPSIDNSRVIVCGDKTSEPASRHKLLNRGPGSTGHRVPAGTKYLTQNLAEAGLFEVAAQGFAKVGVTVSG